MKLKIKKTIMSLSLCAMLLVPTVALAGPFKPKDSYDYHKLHSSWVNLFTKSGGWAETSWPGVVVGTQVFWPQETGPRADGITVEAPHYSKTPYGEGPGSCMSQGYFADRIR